jgi:hypothetical protein
MEVQDYVDEVNGRIKEIQDAEKAKRETEAEALKALLPYLKPFFGSASYVHKSHSLVCAPGVEIKYCEPQGYIHNDTYGVFRDAESFLRAFKPVIVNHKVK